MRQLCFAVLLLSGFCFGQTRCSVSHLKILSSRDSVLSDLKERGCELKINAPSGGLEDDLVLTSSDDHYSYYEVMFADGKLAAVWSYSPLYTSAEEAFSALYRELVAYSDPDQPGSKGADVLGQRAVAAQVFLQRPLHEELGLKKIGFRVKGGVVYYEQKKAKDGTLCAQISTVRHKTMKP